MRIFTESERRQMCRKAGDLEELESHGVTMSDARVFELTSKGGVTISFHGGLPELNRAIAYARSHAFDDCEFVAYRLSFDDNAVIAVYAVNTEGYDYARYAGLMRRYL